MADWIEACESVRAHLKAFRAIPVQQRYEIVVALRERSWTLEEIAAATGYSSRERVRQILKRRQGDS